MTGKDAETALQSLLTNLQEALDTIPHEEGAPDFAGMEMLVSPDRAQTLFHHPVAACRTALLKELEVRRFRNGIYCRTLYAPESDEVAIADTAADLSFVQMERLGAQSRRQLADESEAATAFILSVYLAFAMLERQQTDASFFRRLFSLSWQNYFLHFNSRSVRRFYDKSWGGRYSPEEIFYPLG